MVWFLTVMALMTGCGEWGEDSGQTRSAPGKSAEIISATQIAATDATRDTVPVVIDLQMSIKLAEFVRASRNNLSGGAIEKVRLTLFADKTECAVEIKNFRNGESRRVQRGWYERDKDELFKDMSVREISRAFAAKKINQGAGFAPTAAFFRRALWSISAAAQEEQASAIELTIEKNAGANSGYGIKAVITGGKGGGRRLTVLSLDADGHLSESAATANAEKQPETV